MKQTEQYQLSQWEQEDRILREDFNADNAKIEAAIAGLRSEMEAAKAENCWKKLMEFTTNTDSSQVSVELSAVDLTQYTEIQLYMHLLTSTGNENGYFLCNNISDNIYSHGTYTSAQFGPVFSNGADPSFTKITVILHDDALHAFSEGGRWKNGTYYSWQNEGYSIQIGAAQLQSLNIYPNKTTYQILAGSQFTLFGLKR